MALPQDSPPYPRKSLRPASVPGKSTNNPNGLYPSSTPRASPRPHSVLFIPSTGDQPSYLHTGPLHSHSKQNPFLADTRRPTPLGDFPSSLSDRRTAFSSSSSSSSSASSSSSSPSSPRIRLRSWRRRLLARKTYPYYSILALIALFSLFYLQPVAPLWRSGDLAENPSSFPSHPPLRQGGSSSKEGRLRPADDRSPPPPPPQLFVPDQGSDPLKVTPDDENRPNLQQESSLSGSNGQQKNVVDPELIVLYRILGNDLPPRHRPGQTLSNLRFILEHESSFDKKNATTASTSSSSRTLETPILPLPLTFKVQKKYVLNRMVDPEAESSIIQLLERHGQDYIRIPFDEQEYLQTDFRLEDFPEPDFFSSDDYSTFSKVAKLRVLDYSFHDKNNYAMNNNGGRNVALQHARTRTNARWIFAFDGSSFLTEHAMADIQRALRNHGDSVHYVAVPMARLIDNGILLRGTDARPESKEEPQIIFRNDATESYNPLMRYGRRSKLEMLWRLGVLERSKLSKPSVSWEPKEREPLLDKNEYGTAGWVFRLFSGKKSQEENTRQSAALRAYNRLLAIQDLIEGVDERIARQSFRSEDLLVYKESILKQNRRQYWLGEPAVLSMVQRLEVKASGILSRRASVLRRTSAEHLVLYPADSQGNPITAATSPISSASSSRRGSSSVVYTFSPNAITLQGVYDEVTTLTLAHYFTGNETFSRAAANIVRTTLLQEPETPLPSSASTSAHSSAEDTEYLLDHGYSFPALNRLPRVIRGRDGSAQSRAAMKAIPKDLLKADTLPSFLDAVRMLYRTHVLTQNEYAQLSLVFSTWLEHFVNSAQGISMAKQGDHRAAFMDLHVAALAAMTDDVRLFLRVVNRGRMRIGRQFRTVQDGMVKMPFESAFATRQSMAGLLQPGGAGADVTGQELAGMYSDEEAETPDHNLEPTSKHPSKGQMGSMARGYVVNEEKDTAVDPALIEELAEDEESSPLADDTSVQSGSKVQSDVDISSSPQDQPAPDVTQTTAARPFKDPNEVIMSVEEMTEMYSTLNLQYWTLLTRMVDNSAMASAPDLWRHRSRRGYRLSDIVRNYLRQDHCHVSGAHKMAMDSLTYTARASFDHTPARFLRATAPSSDAQGQYRPQQQHSLPLARSTNPANQEVLEWGHLGMPQGALESLAKDDERFQDALGGSIPGNGVPPFWMLGVLH